MSLLPAEASYLEHVSTLFLSLRGDGVALSPNDAELLLDWERRGVPYEVVLRGIKRAVEGIVRDARPGAGVRTLRSCRAHVEREFLRWQGLSAGGRGKADEEAALGAAPGASAPTAADDPNAGGPGGPATQGGEPSPTQQFAARRLKQARALLEKALAAAPSPAHAAALRGALAVIAGAAAHEACDAREASRRIARADDALALVYVRALPPEQRRALIGEARRQAGPRPTGSSPRGRKDALRTHLVALARAQGPLVSLVV